MNIKTNSARISFKNCEYEGEISQNRPHGRGFAFFQSGNAYYGSFFFYFHSILNFFFFFFQAIGKKEILTAMGFICILPGF